MENHNDKEYKYYNKYNYVQVNENQQDLDDDFTDRYLNEYELESNNIKQYISQGVGTISSDLYLKPILTINKEVSTIDLSAKNTINYDETIGSNFKIKALNYESREPKIENYHQAKINRFIKAHSISNFDLFTNKNNINTTNNSKIYKTRNTNISNNGSLTTTNQNNNSIEFNRKKEGKSNNKMYLSSLRFPESKEEIQLKNLKKVAQLMSTKNIFIGIFILL